MSHCPAAAHRASPSARSNQCEHCVALRYHARGLRADTARHEVHTRRWEAQWPLAQGGAKKRLCEPHHTRWKAKLLWSGLEQSTRAKGREEMMEVATALVESTLAEALLVISVALLAVLVLGVLVRRA